ncbi:MAG: sterol desaturase family protein [Pseudomonadota bacterium]
MQSFVETFVDHAWHVLIFPLDPNNRIYLLYVATSLVFAFGVYKFAQRRAQHEGSFLRFLFPKDVWSHPSAWLDVRYFFFHQLIGHFLLLGFGAGLTSLFFGWVTGGASITEVAGRGNESGIPDLVLAVGYMFVALIVIDFIGWYMHYLQHKVPVLWQFHKVHHSAEVMHPLSNYREHPVDNLAYGVFVGIGYGVVNGVAVNVVGHLPGMPSLLGVPLLMLVFNLFGYNLRHSHIWLRWPGVWSKVFPSPAHHHIHHSCHPDHIDKNFAFMFPFWDVIFKTYHMPKDNRDVKFGVPEYDGKDLDSCINLYLVPFRDAYRLLRKPKMTKDNAVAQTPLPLEEHGQP